MSTLATLAVKVFSIGTAFTFAGGIAALSAFSVPELQSQPASRSLPSVRWLFSRGSHIFPQAGTASSAGFCYLAYQALPTTSGVLSLLNVGANGRVVNGYLLAAALVIGIGPVTGIMLPIVNIPLIQLTEDLGGARSQASAEYSNQGGKTAMESISGKGDISEFTDLSNPQTETARPSTAGEDARARELLATFGWMNAARSVLMLVGGIVGLGVALGA
ncbi:hypothetical protein LTR08_003682 [Meristemomyces frigidus]|nr:hypothetical protein LTR08_003682 [Meristemomyces frigidus]